MQQKTLKIVYKESLEKTLSHRYITNDYIEPLLQKLPSNFKVLEIGKSVNKKPIYSVQFGTGPKKLLFWSQMHGNESTTTKALFDVFNLFINNKNTVNHILEACTLLVIPILNPDGAQAYTRVNANKVDLNRDAQNLSQPESKVLKQVFLDFKPNFCFNLHGQRTIFNVGNTSKPATLSFLAPAQDEACTITNTRKKAMEVIVAINNVLQECIPNQVGIYDDAFNINCVGDTFQSNNVPTILFEAGHFKNDYSREQTREYIFKSLLTAINYIAITKVSGDLYKPYLKIPENNKQFYDVIIRNAAFKEYGDTVFKDIAIQFQERLIKDTIKFIPKVEAINNLKDFYGHKEVEASKCKVNTIDKETIYVGYENDFVLINNELFSLI